MKMPMNPYPLTLMVLLLLTPPAMAENYKTVPIKDDGDARAGTPLGKSSSTEPARTSTLKNFGMPPGKLQVIYNYYEVQGRDLETVFGQMDRIGPFMKNDGKTAHGLTHWKVFWPSKYTFTTPDNVCIQFNVTVTGEIVFTMPQWTGHPQASAELKKRWDAFYQALQKHEDGHALNGVGALKEIAQLQPVLTPGRTCQAIAENFNARAMAITKKYNRKDIEFDLETQRRHRQGTGP